MGWSEINDLSSKAIKKFVGQATAKNKEYRTSSIVKTQVLTSQMREHEVLIKTNILNFEVKGVDGSYVIVEICSNKKFKNSKKRIVKNISTTFKRGKTTTYYVRVRAMNKDKQGTIYGKYSKVYQYKVKG